MSTAKVLCYTHGLVDGGAERLWACLASALKQRGYDVVFVQDFEAEDNRSNLDPSIPLITLGRGHFRATWRLADVLRQERPDVALSAVGGCNTKLLAAIALSRSPTKAIISYHGYNEWKTGWLSWFTYLTLPLLSRLACRTIAVSEGLRNELVQRWRADPDRTVTIHNPVFFPNGIKVPSPQELAARDPIILAVGRMVPEKDFRTLVRAFKRVRTPGARLVILGKGPQQGMIAGGETPRPGRSDIDAWLQPRALERLCHGEDVRFVVRLRTLRQRRRRGHGIRPPGRSDRLFGPLGDLEARTLRQDRIAGRRSAAGAGDRRHTGRARRSGGAAQARRRILVRRSCARLYLTHR